jgi:hypothetical protein
MNTLLGPFRAVSKSLNQLTPQQQQSMMYWVGGLSPLATNLVTPVVTHYRLKMTNLPEQERRMNVVQEVARQVVSAGLQLTSFFGGAWLMKKLGGGAANKAGSNTLLQFLGGVFFAFLSYAFIRPLISTEIVLHYLYPKANKNLVYFDPKRQQDNFEAFTSRIAAQAHWRSSLL